MHCIQQVATCSTTRVATFVDQLNAGMCHWFNSRSVPKEWINGL